jgi:hypothetical protein
MTLSVTFSLVAGTVWVSSDSSEDTQSVTAARGSDAAGGGPEPFRRAPHTPERHVPASHVPLVPSRPLKVAIPAIFIEAAVTGLGLDMVQRRRVETVAPAALGRAGAPCVGVTGSAACFTVRRGSLAAGGQGVHRPALSGTPPRRSEWHISD